MYSVEVFEQSLEKVKLFLDGEFFISLKRVDKGDLLRLIEPLSIHLRGFSQKPFGLSHYRHI